MPTLRRAGSRASLPSSDDLVHERRPTVDEAGVDLHEGGSGCFFGEGVFGCENSSRSDDGDVLAETGVKLRDNFGGM